MRRSTAERIQAEALEANRHLNSAIVAAVDSASPSEAGEIKLRAGEAIYATWTLLERLWQMQPDIRPGRFRRRRSMTGEKVPSGVAPHEGVELDLMLKRRNPLAMFLQAGYGPPRHDAYDHLDEVYALFGPHVDLGRFVVREDIGAAAGHG